MVIAHDDKSLTLQEVLSIFRLCVDIQSWQARLVIHLLFIVTIRLPRSDLVRTSNLLSHILPGMKKHVCLACHRHTNCMVTLD